MTQAKPSGQMGNPRRYASQPNRRFIKDSTTGKYHENLCYVGPKGGGKGSGSTGSSGLSKAKSARKKPPNTPGNAVDSLADQMGWEIPGKLPKMLDYTTMQGDITEENYELAKKNYEFATLFNARALYQYLGGGDDNYQQLVDELALGADRNIHLGKGGYGGRGKYSHKGQGHPENFNLVADYIGNRNGKEYMELWVPEGSMIRTMNNGGMEYDSRRDKYVRWNDDRGCYEEARATTLTGQAIRNPSSLRWRKADDTSLERSRQESPRPATKARAEGLRGYGYADNDTTTFAANIKHLGDSSKFPPAPELIDRSDVGKGGKEDTRWQSIFNARQTSQWLGKRNPKREDAIAAKIADATGDNGYSKYEDNFAFLASKLTGGKSRVKMSGDEVNEVFVYGYDGMKGGILYRRDHDLYMEPVYADNGDYLGQRFARATYDDGSPIFDREDLAWGRTAGHIYNHWTRDDSLRPRKVAEEARWVPKSKRPRSVRTGPWA